MNVTDLVDQFGRHVDAGDATVLVGAGLSMAAGYPAWKTLVEPLRNELGLDPMDDLPLLAQFYETAMAGGRERLVEHVRQQFQAVGTPAPTRAHQLVAQLPIRHFWTTNYDDLLDRAVGGAHVVFEDIQLAAPVEPGARVVYKMHGSTSPAGPIVLTRDDFDSYPYNWPRFASLLRASFLTQSFLFLGFSFSDPNFDEIFRFVRLWSADVQRQHYALLKRPGDAASADGKLFERRVAELERVGVRVCVVDQHEDVEVVLGRLVARCRPPQLLISGSAPGPRDPVAPSDQAYPTSPLPDGLVNVARAIAHRLADTDIAVIAAGEAGATVGYELMLELQRRGRYNPGRFTLVRRARDEPLTPPSTRLGTAIFTGEEANDLRSDALSRVRAVLVLGGSEGAAAEVSTAEGIGLGIVPVGATAGTARDIWERIGADIGSLRLGGRAVDHGDFELLANENVDTAAAAAVRLVQQAMYLT